MLFRSWPFFFLVAAFAGLLLLTMRGTGATPTVVRSATVRPEATPEPRPGASGSPGA